MTQTKALKRFLIKTSVENAEGSQTWYVDAENEAEALQKYNNGKCCDIYANEVEVTWLGQPELAGETTLDDFGDFGDEALAQKEQEPVAWIHNFIDGGISIGKRPADLNRHPDRWTALYKEPKPCPTCEALARTVMLDQTSHDTTPPQRKPLFVGLTDEEIAEFDTWHDNREEEAGWCNPSEIVAYIEAKLRSKNNG